MTRKQFRIEIIIVIAFFLLTIILGYKIYYCDQSINKSNFQIFKDLIPLMIAIPAAYLGYCFQRRSSFLLTLRVLWTNMISSVNAAIQYSESQETTITQYKEILFSLSKSIDEVRSVYKNLDEKKGEIGLYPFECLKNIYIITENLGYGKLDPIIARESTEHIKHHWKDLRKTFLHEFDRSEPTVYSTPYQRNK